MGPLISTPHLSHLLILFFIALIGGRGHMCPTTKRLIVHFNCIQWIVTEVGKEVRALAET